MRVTIGELIELLTPWSNRIETLMIYNKPFMKVYMTGLYGIPRFYLYVTQSDENVYQAIDSEDDINDRYLPTGLSSNPFVKEKDLAKEWFDQKSCDKTHFKDNLNFESFNRYLLEKLYQYNVIRFNQEDLKKSIVSDMGFNSSKIRRILTERFKEYHAKDRTVEEFINIVMVKKQHFDLYPMKPKEVNCIFAMLKNLGLEAKIDKNIIVGLDYIRRK